LAHDTLIVGAGVAGLGCAAALHGTGGAAEVLERSPGLGGRCATRRVDGQPVDHGLSFLHGSDPDFVAALQGVGDGLVGWPLRVSGRGAPCQPQAFSPREFRVAFAEGVSAFPKWLARGLQVQHRSRVTALRLADGEIEVAVEGQAPRRSRDVVLALALEQSLELVKTLPTGVSEELDGARALLEMEASVPCLTLIAGYDPDVPNPPWDVCYPDQSAILGLISNDSAKRPTGAARVLVCQALPRYSRDRLSAPEETWAAEMIREAERLVGAWAGRPRHTQPHRWRFARVEQSERLAAPLLLGLPGGARLGICGDAFAPSGGVEAAWLSGRRLASRILKQE